MKSSIKFGIIDCETNKFLKKRFSKPFLWGFYDGEIYKCFENKDDLIEFLKPQNMIIYAHNGGKFDFHFLIEYFEPFSDIMLINGRISKFKIGNCEFRDSYNILPIPLSTYKKDEIDYNLFEENIRDEPLIMKKIKEYLKSDCYYLYELVKSFIEEYGKPLTVASSAIKVWNTKFFDAKENTNKTFYEEIKPFYYGGRTECFKKGIINYPTKLYDINSAYPYAMTFDHPYGSSLENTVKMPTKNRELCFFDITAKSVGMFPFLEKKEYTYHLTFPDDGEYRRFKITGWELIACEELGLLEIKEIHKIKKFFKTINFTNYVEHYYKIKENSPKNSPEYIKAKLKLTNLYGKFGANPEKYKEYMLIPPEYRIAAEADGYSFSGEIGDYFLIEKPLPEFKQVYHNVATAASITGFVRAMLAKEIKKSRDIVYCDTDSIIAREAYPKISGKLGDWELENSFEHGAVAGKKTYAFKIENIKKWKTASKGSKLTYKEIIKVAKGDKVIYESDVPVYSFKQGIRFIDKEIKMT